MNDVTAHKLSAIASISDPTRRALFDFVSRNHEAISRDQAASALDLPRATAAFHLDRLVDDGALEVEFKRLSGKTGPGSGRPSKLYHRSNEDLAISIPERHYELAGELLASAVEEADRSGISVRDALSKIATDTGRRIGADSASLTVALENIGYEPIDDGAGGMVLSNCPFHSLATSHTEIICDANLGLLQGVAEGCGCREDTVVFDPGEGHCCVRIAPASG